MDEHWSLVISKRQEPNWESFAAGDFQSATLDETAGRLDKALQSGLQDVEMQAFRRIRAHRNKAVHFFHEAHSAKENAELLQTIAKEQLAGWYFLHRLLTTRWRKAFKPWLQRIGELDKQIRKHHTFLQVVYDQVRPELSRRKKAGEDVAKCPSCGFVALPKLRAIGEFSDSECLVCGLGYRGLNIECPECDEKVEFENGGYAKCPGCNTSFEPANLLKIITNSEEAHRTAKDGGQYYANCSDCDGYHTVIPYADGHVCASCFGRFDSVQDCDWCNEPNTGDMENSYSHGCNCCEGRIGWEADD